MNLLIKRLSASFLIAALSLSGSPAWASVRAKAPASFFGDEDGPFVRQFYRGRAPQASDLPVGHQPQMPAPSLNGFLPEFQDSAYLAETLTIPNDPYYSSKGSLYSAYTQLEDLWGVKLLNAEAAWDFTRGSGVVVAVVDTGVYLNHAELQGNIWSNPLEKNGIAGVDDDGNGFIDDVNGWDFVDDDTDPSDLNGHGTHVAGIIGALGDNNKGITGIAPESDIMAVRVLDPFGDGFFADIASGIRYAAVMGAKVINLSLGVPIFGLPQSDIDLVLSAIRYARDLGAIVVVAAGNSNGDIANQIPARFDEVISVGALRHQYDFFYGNGPLSRAGFSEKGEELDFMAPGTDILSLAVDPATFAGYDVFLKDGEYYSPSDGTSMATPMVSGLIALLLAQDPLQTFRDIYRRLQYSSIDMGATGFDNLYGYGRVNAYTALSRDYYDNGVTKVQRLAFPNTIGISRYDFYPDGSAVAVALDGSVYAYYSSRNLRSVVDGSTQIFKEYYDENFYGLDADGFGKGRLSRILSPDGMEFRFLKYWDDTETVIIKEYFESGVFIKRLEYAPDGLTLLKLTLPDGSVFAYYPSGNLKSILREYILEEYFNENFYGSDADGYGRGRLARLTAADGNTILIDEYWDGTDKIKTTSEYHPTSHKTFIDQTEANGYSYAYPSLLGDINGDGLDDVAMIQNISGSVPYPGKVVVFFNNTFSLKDYDLLNPALNGKDGFVFEGMPSDVEFVSNAHDVNGDGYADLVVKVKKKTFLAGDITGSTYVVFGKKDAFPPFLNAGDLDGQNGFVIPDQRTVSGNFYNVQASDFNGDQRDDLIFRQIDNAKDQTYILYGKGGSYDASTNLAGLNGANGFIIKADLRAGLPSMSLTYDFNSDINGDGNKDIIAALRGYEVTRPREMRISVIYGGQAMPAVIDLNANNFLNGQNGFVFTGVSTDIYETINGESDFNGDGINDLFIAPTHTLSSIDDGSKSIHVVFGSGSGGPANIYGPLNGTNGFSIKSASATKGLSPFSQPADINNDGATDLVIRVNDSTFGSDNTKDIYVVYGKSTRSSGTVNLDLLNSQGSFVIKAYPQTGGTNKVETEIEAVDDMNGDGYRELVVSVIGYDPANRYRVKTYVIFGKEKFTQTINLQNLTLNGNDGFIIEDIFSRHIPIVAVHGDLNGDGYGELWVDTFNTRQADGSGAGYFIYGSAGTFPPAVRLGDLDGTLGFKVTGNVGDFYISNSGDYNHDGFTDLLFDNELPNSFNPPAYLPQRDYYILYGQSRPFPGSLDLTLSESVTRKEYFISGNEARALLPNGQIIERFDENFYGVDALGRGQGRISRSIEADGRVTRVLEYWTDTDQVKIDKVYQSDILQKTREYYLSGAISTETLPSGDVKTFYENGVLKSHYDPNTGKTEEYSESGVLTRIFLSDGNIITYYPSGNPESFYKASTQVYMFFLDELFFPTGFGRVSREITPDGGEIRYLEYWTGTDRVKIKELHQSGVLLKTLEYAEDGVTVVKTILPSGDAYTYYPSGNVKDFYQAATGNTITFLDENFYGNDADGRGQGRKSSEITTDGKETRYLEYWSGTDSVKIKEIYQSGVLQKTEEFYFSGNLYKRTLPSGEVEIYYENGVLMSRRSAEGITDEYSEAGALIKKTLASGDYYTYFPSGNVSSRFEANTHSFYLDENFYGPDEYGHGLGRLSKALFSSGAETHYIAYYGRTDIVKTQHFFYNGVYQGMAAYDSSGRLVKETSADGSTRVYRYRRFPGKLELSLSTISFYDASGILVDYESYDSSERLLKWILYIVESGERAISYQADFTYHSRGYNLKELSYEYAEGILPFRLERVFEDHSVYNGSIGALTFTSRKTTSYIYNSAGRRYTGSVETFTYHPSTEQGEEPLKSHTTDRYELNSNENGTQRVFYENIQYLADGLTVKQFERKSWTYYRNGRTKTHEVHVNRPGTIYHRIYEYDANERVKEVRNLVHYESGNIKTERLNYARVTYEYKDENFDGMGKGRLIKKTNRDNTYEVYSYWGETDELSKIEYYRANGTRYRVDVFERLVPEDPGVEAAAFGGDGYFDMLQKKTEERRSSSSQGPLAGFLAGAVSEL